MVKDVITVAALFATVWTYSVEWLVWGQLAASFVTWIISIDITRRSLEINASELLTDLLPFLAASLAMGAGCFWLGMLSLHPAVILTIELSSGLVVYVAVLKAGGNAELHEGLAMLRRRLKRI